MAMLIAEMRDVSFTGNFEVVQDASLSQTGKIFQSHSFHLLQRSQ